MANTAFNSSDKSASITLTGSNLIATGNAAAIGSVRAADAQANGKFYWELTFNTVVNSNTGVGVANLAFPLASSIGSGSGNGVGSAGVNQGGTYVVEGVVKTSLGGAFTAGSVCCIALDLNARLIWFRQGAAGNWNGNSSNNPATGVGGAPFSGWGGAFNAYPIVSIGTTSDQITANFGGSAFAGAVPSGFTSGFISGATNPHQRARHSIRTGTVLHHPCARASHSSRVGALGDDGDGSRAGDGYTSGA